MSKWGNLVEQVRRDRIKIAVAAWSYERGYRHTMTDTEYDELSQRVHSQRNTATGNHRLDRFFQRHFDPDTGLWIHRHPDLASVERIYAQVWIPKLYAHELKRAQRRVRRQRR
jgi:hypothetical protein